MGAKAWHELERSTMSRGTSAEMNARQGITVDKPGQTYDGFTLYTTTEGAWATLIDMRGTVVHRWELPFSQAWPHAPHVPDQLADERIHWFRCYLYPNGDLLAIYHAESYSHYGYGLVKLNKDSKLLWAYPNRVHHDVDVGEDGTIYTLTHKLVSNPPAGLDFLPSPYIADYLVVLSPEGRELGNIPILEAVANSQYSLSLTSFTTKSLSLDSFSVAHPPDWQDPPNSKGDILHTNSVKVLSRALAPEFPLFKPGQVLLSMRNLDTLAVLDRPTRSVAWAARGIWLVQHDAEFLQNGRLLLFDNFGSTKGSQVLEYDPRTQAIPWAYAHENSTPFRARWRGMKQRLPNGNTLIVDPDNGRLLEVTRDKELVWENYCLTITGSHDPRRSIQAITSARRYSLDELKFLKGIAHARRSD
jgi:hypothetical protein